MRFLMFALFPRSFLVRKMLVVVVALNRPHECVPAQEPSIVFRKIRVFLESVPVERALLRLIFGPLELVFGNACPEELFRFRAVLELELSLES